MKREWNFLITLPIVLTLSLSQVGVLIVKAQNNYSDGIYNSAISTPGTGNLSRYEQFKAHKQFMEGYKAYQNRQFRNAIAYFNECISIDPRHPEVYRFRGESFIGLEDYRSALSDFNYAVINNPRDPQILNFRGICYYMSGQYNEALRDFEMALSIDPSFIDASENRLLVLNESGNNMVTSSTPGGNIRPQYSYMADQQSTIPGANIPSSPITIPSNSLGPASSLGPVTSSNASSDRIEALKREAEAMDAEDPFDNDPFPVSIDEETNEEVEDGEVYTYPDVLKQTSRDVFISEVKLSASGTYVTLTIKPRRRLSFSFDRPDDSFDAKNAIVAADQNFLRTYRLVRLQDIKWNEKVILAAGESRDVVLQFEPLPEETKIFHIRQGNNPLEGAWNFYEIKLEEDDDEATEGNIR